MFIGKAQGLAVSAGQRLVFSSFAVAIYRANGVDDMLRPKSSSAGDHCLALGQAANLLDDNAAFLQDRRATSVVDRSIDSTASEQGRVGSIYDGVCTLLGDVVRP